MASKAKILELVESLEKLLALKVEDKQSLKTWYELAYRTEEHIYANNLHDVIPEFIIHYLSDADIRLKDSEYSMSQNSEMKMIIEKLKLANI